MDNDFGVIINKYRGLSLPAKEGGGEEVRHPWRNLLRSPEALQVWSNTIYFDQEKVGRIFRGQKNHFDYFSHKINIGKNYAEII